MPGCNGKGIDIDVPCQGLCCAWATWTREKHAFRSRRFQRIIMLDIRIGKWTRTNKRLDRDVLDTSAC
eukprot:3449483-Pyramimonas_sp.AAC.1